MLQLPIGAENEFEGVVDLIEMKALSGRMKTWARLGCAEIPLTLKDKADEYREQLIETAVELDEAAMEAYLEGEMPEKISSVRLIRKGTINVDFFPCSVEQRSRTKVFSRFLMQLSTSCQARSMFPRFKASTQDEKRHTREASDDEPLSMLAFKVMNDPFVGYADLLLASTPASSRSWRARCSTPFKDKRERVGRMLADALQRAVIDIDRAFRRRHRCRWPA